MRMYRHFKGKVYKVLFEARHTETDEKMIIYKDESGHIYARPAHIFFGEVECNGQTFPRFSEIKEK